MLTREQKLYNDMTHAFAKPNIINDPEGLISDNVNHPSHYTFGNYEVLDVMEDWGLHKNYYLANVLKYIARADHKGKPIEDLEKALFYLTREIHNRKMEAEESNSGLVYQDLTTMEPGDEIDDLQPEASLPPNFWTNLLEKVKGKL